MNKISQLRKARHIKQSDLAKMLGVVQATLSNWETGKFDIDNASLQKVADYFNVTTDYILGRIDDPTPPFKAPETFHTVPMAPPPDKEQKKEAPTVTDDGLSQKHRDFIEKITKLDPAQIQMVEDIVDSVLRAREK